mgnify:CR=1 FL=1
MQTEVTDEEVDAEIKKLQEQQAELVLKEDQPAAEGDTVVIDFEGKVDGQFLSLNFVDRCFKDCIFTLKVFSMVFFRERYVNFYCFTSFMPN